MHSLRKPHWVFLTNTGPVGLLLALCYGEFSVVHTLLPPASVVLWQRFGLALALLGVGGAAYAGVQLLRRLPLSAWYSVVQLLAYSTFLCLFTVYSNEVMPRSIPRWMVPTDLTVMAWTFLMPTLAHAMLALVARFTAEDQPQYVAPNLLMAVAVPMGWGLLFGIWTALPWDERGSEVAGVAFVTVLVLSTLSFFFFLVRAVYIITLRRTGEWAEASIIWKSIITMLLPLLGLGVNNGLFFGRGFQDGNGIFGNFSSSWFYILAVLNGVLLCVPSSEQPPLRLAQLVGRSALFGYTFYFFLIFLPFLPLSIPAILLIGTGFLLLAPTLLFVLHVRQLSDDVTALRAVYSRAAVTTALVGGLAVLPLYITASYWHSRQVLHAALAYVCTPNYAEKQATLDATTLTQTLAVVKAHKDQNREFFFGTQLPYLSTYFNWLVLDNLMLSNDKIADLERVFAGVAGPRVDVARPFMGREMAAPVLRNLTANSTYDARQQAWVSWVNLEIANADASVQNGEYSSTLTLPTGCWVSDYYLTIGNRQERGILAEKRAATWVFAQIVSENQSRDPGLLAYSGPNQVAVRVYPVVGPATRQTRIQLLHKEPCTISIDGRQLALGDSATTHAVAAPVATPDGGVVYLSGLAKKKLPLVQRHPYYHFLLDASVNGAAPAAYQERVAQQLARRLPNGGPARFSLVNAASTPVPADADWVEALRNTRPAGGFFLTGAMRRVLFEAQQHPSATYPVMVVVTDSIDKAVLEPDFEDFTSAYPESDVFYVLRADGSAEPHSLRHNSARAFANQIPSDSSRSRPTAVRAWPNLAHALAYLPDNDTPDIVLGQPQAVPAASAAPGNRWLTGLLLRGYGQWQSFHPESTDRERVPFIQASFRAGIMTPFTSFLALENDAQKAALARKQEQTLAANASLDTLENDEAKPTAIPLDGGTGLLLVAGLLLAGWHLRRAGQVSLPGH